MNPPNLPWEEQYQAMQNQIDELRFEINRNKNNANHFRFQCRIKERQLAQVQMMLRNLSETPEHLPQIIELERESEMIVAQLTYLENEIQGFLRQRRQFERELCRLENEAEQFAQENRNQE